MWLRKLEATSPSSVTRAFDSAQAPPADYFSSLRRSPYPNRRKLSYSKTLQPSHTTTHFYHSGRNLGIAGNVSFNLTLCPQEIYIVCIFFLGAKALALSK